VVDAPDLSLNMSREMLQQTPLVEAIKKQLTKRVLKKLEEVARTSPEDYDKAWAEYGAILKEGVAEDDRQRKQLTGLLRYPTTTSGGALRSLAQVKADLPEGQDTLWYYTSVDKERIGQAPVLEGFKKRDLEVLLMADPVDEWVVMHVTDLDGTKLQSVMTGELPEEAEDDKDPVAEAARKQAAPLVTWMKDLLGGAVADVRVSSRLTDSPSVLVDAQGGVSSNMERILKAANQMVPPSQRVLEINPEHPMVKTLTKLNADGATGIEPFARLLLDHAAIAEGRLDDPQGFARRLQALMERAAGNMGTGDGTPEAPLEPEIVTPEA
jgi:molecular chaperone HtpG